MAHKQRMPKAGCASRSFQCVSSLCTLKPGKTQAWDGCSSLVLFFFFFVFSLGHGWSSSTSGYGKDAQAVSSVGWGFREHF